MKSLNKVSNHILPNASTMLGVCMMVISILDLSGAKSHTWGDEVLAVDSVLFALSALLSYLSIRSSQKSATHDQNFANKLEDMADKAFVMGLILMSMVCIGMVFTPL